MNLTADNLTIETKRTEDGRCITVEPEFVKYLRSQGYPINAVNDMRAIPSETTDGKAYIVCKIETLRYPKGHPRLDLVKDEIEIPVCSCWDYRSNSPDVAEDATPAEAPTCKHLLSAYKELRAKEDEQQETL